MQGNTTRRTVLVGTGAAVSAGLAGCLGDDDPDPDDDPDADPDDDPDADPDEWEATQDITMLVPFGEGGGTDTYMRNFGPAVADRYDVNWRVENLSSAGGMEAMGQAISADPDGHTITCYNPPSTPITYMLLEPPFDIEELVPICIYARTNPAYLLYGQVEHEFDGIQDVIDRYNDGEFSALGVQDTGGPTTVMAIILRDNPDIDWNWDSMVNYGGTGPVAADLAAGDLDAAIASDTGGLPVWESNPDAFEPIAYMHTERSVFRPDLDIPTFPDEMGVNMDFLAALDRVILGPPGMSGDIVSSYEATFEEVLTEDEEVLEWAEEGGWALDFAPASDAESLLNDVFEEIPAQLDLDELRAEFG